MTEDARQILMKAKLFRLFALLFAFVGVLLFIALYLRHVDGSFLSSLRNPFIVLIFLLPFLPALALSLLAGKIESDYKRKYLKKDK
jgi:xanthine/uracil/vitamin C permease (AzgA family)